MIRHMMNHITMVRNASTFFIITLLFHKTVHFSKFQKNVVKGEIELMTVTGAQRRSPNVNRSPRRQRSHQDADPTDEEYERLRAYKVIGF